MLILWTYLNLSFQCWGAFAVTFHSAIMNCATKNTLECVSWHINAGVTLKLTPRSGTGGHRVYEHSTLEKNAKRFSTMVISIYIPASDTCMFLLIHLFPNTWYIQTSFLPVSLWVWFTFPSANEVEHLFMHLLATRVFSRVKMPISVSCPLFYLVVLMQDFPKGGPMEHGSCQLTHEKSLHVQLSYKMQHSPSHGQPQGVLPY